MISPLWREYNQDVTTAVNEIVKKATQTFKKREQDAGIHSGRKLDIDQLLLTSFETRYAELLKAEAAMTPGSKKRKADADNTVQSSTAPVQSATLSTTPVESSASPTTPVTAAVPVNAGGMFGRLGSLHQLK